MPYVNYIFIYSIAILHYIMLLKKNARRLFSYYWILMMYYLNPPRYMCVPMCAVLVFVKRASCTYQKLIM